MVVIKDTIRINLSAELTLENARESVNEGRQGTAAAYSSVLSSVSLQPALQPGGKFIWDLLVNAHNFNQVCGYSGQLLRQGRSRAGLTAL